MWLFGSTVMCVGICMSVVMIGRRLSPFASALCVRVSEYMRACDGRVPVDGGLLAIIRPIDVTLARVDSNGRRAFGGEREKHFAIAAIQSARFDQQCVRIVVDEVQIVCTATHTRTNVPLT